MEQSSDFDTDVFFDDGPIQQIDPNTDLGALQSVSLASHPALIESILSLQSCGCSQRIAWSRLGQLASISDDGQKVTIKALDFQKRPRSWALGQHQTLPGDFQDAKSLAWSPTGGDLAISDSKGRVSIFQAQPMALNRLIEVRQAALDEPDELGRIIGFQWLGQDRPDRVKHVIINTSKSQDRWVHEHLAASPLSPLWQRAVVIVNRRGTLSLLYQRLDGKYDKVSIPLPFAPNVLYTHAAFAPTVEGKLIVALNSTEASIAICLVQIDFTQLKQNIDGKVVLTAELATSGMVSSATGNLIDGDSYDADVWALTHLEIIPTSDAEKALQLPPTLLAIYLSRNKNIAVTDPGYLISGNIRRWTINSVEQNLHPRFDELPSKASGKVEPIFTINLLRQMDRDEQVVISAILFENNTSLVLTTQDGRTDFLNTDDFSSQSYGVNDNEVKTLMQSGFSFPLFGPPVQVSLSPNGCVIASIDTEDKTDLTKMELQNRQDASVEAMGPTPENAFAAVVLGFARACWSTANFDDILCMAQHTFSDDEAPRIVTSLYRTLFRDTEFVATGSSPSDLEKVVQKPILAKVLSFHAGLIFTRNGPTNWDKRSLASSWVWMANNFRFVALLIYGGFKEMTNPASSVTQDLVDVVCNNIMWSLDVIRFIASSVLEVSYRKTNPEFFDSVGNSALGDEAGNGSQGLISLLLNCHWTRVFLSVIIRALRTYLKLEDTGFKYQNQIKRMIHQHSMMKGLSLPAIEGILDPRWSAVGDNAMAVPAIAAKQIEMMATGVVHESYSGTIDRLTNVFNARGLREKAQIDLLRLFTDRVDIDWVLLTHSKDSSKLEPGGSLLYDVLKKKVITKGASEVNGTGEPMIRRCVRCGSYNEDVNGMRRDSNRLISSMMLRCVCDGQWVIEPWKNRVDK